jgi:hypothetical protein
MCVCREAPFLLVVLCCCACQASDSETTSVFSPEVEQVVLEVDYQPGAQPYFTGTRKLNVWKLYEANTQALFRETSPALLFPRSNDEAEELPDVTARGFSAEEILAIAEEHRDERDTSDRRSFYALFLAGHYVEKGEPNPDVLGVSIGSTGVIALFKPAVQAASSSRPAQGSYIEQSTLIHELGHAVGLVDNGLPMTTPHVDHEHGAHCSDPGCVMYHQNEGASGLLRFIKDYVKSDDAVLFGQACLQDAHAAARNQ